MPYHTSPYEWNKYGPMQWSEDVYLFQDRPVLLESGHKDYTGADF